MDVVKIARPPGAHHSAEMKNGGAFRAAKELGQRPRVPDVSRDDLDAFRNRGELSAGRSREDETSDVPVRIGNRQLRQPVPQDLDQAGSEPARSARDETERSAHSSAARTRPARSRPSEGAGRSRPGTDTTQNPSRRWFPLRPVEGSAATGPIRPDSAREAGGRPDHVTTMSGRWSTRRPRNLSRVTWTSATSRSSEPAIIRLAKHSRTQAL